MLYGSQTTRSGLSVTSPSSCKKHLDSSGRHTVEDVITSLIWKLVGSQERPQSALTKGCVGPGTPFLSTLSPEPLSSPHIFPSLVLFGSSSDGGCLCNPRLPSQPRKAKDQAHICLSKAIRTSSLSFGNHMDHKPSVYLASFLMKEELVLQITLRMEFPSSLP